MKYKKFKVKEGREAQWRSWCLSLIHEKAQVLETMKEEAVTRETCWIKDGFVYYGMEGLCLPATDREINRLHKQNRRECLEVPGEFIESVPNGSEVLFDFNLPS
ncbi:MAG TPA: hypothetical protein VGE35_03465 [Candidatus Paceibacterota bacterium]